MGLRLVGLVKGIFFFFSILIAFPHSSSAQSEKQRLNVDQLVDEALQNNPEISAAKQRWEVFKEKVLQARALSGQLLGLGILNIRINFSSRDEDMTMNEISISQMFPLRQSPTLSS
jgi:cobalt-zinc-cadmium efflux system outer membrane protein